MALVRFTPLARFDFTDPAAKRQVDLGKGPFPHSRLRLWRAVHERRRRASL